MASLSTNMIKFGQGVISNYNSQLDVGYDVYVENAITSYPVDTYSRRGGLRLIKDFSLPISSTGINKIIQHKITNDIIVSYDNILYNVTKDQILFTQMDVNSYHEMVMFKDKLYFSANNTIYEYDGVNLPVQSTYTPKRYFLAPNSLSFTNGTNNLRIRIPNHNLTVGQLLDIQGFSASYGEVAINQKGIAITSVIDANTIELTYPQAFTFDERYAGEGPNRILQDGGGNGTIVAYYPNRNFPSAKFITTFKNRLYLSGDPVNPNRIYISNLVTPNTTDIGFDVIESASELLNLSISQNIDRSAWINIDPDNNGKIVALHSTNYGVMIFKEFNIYFFQGRNTDEIQNFYANDSVVNPRAVDSNGTLTFFMGTNNLYVIQAGSTVVTPIGNPVQEYIKSAEISRVRIKIWDDNVIVALGDIRNESNRLEYITTSVGQSEDLTNITGLAMVYNIKTQSFVFWSGFNVGDFAIVNQEASGSLNNRRALYLNTNNNLVQYDETYNVDINQEIPMRIVTHARFLGNVGEIKKFTKVRVFTKRAVDIKLFYKLVGSEQSDGSEATEFKNTTIAGGGYMWEALLPTDAQARGIQLMIQAIDNSKYIIIEGYEIISE